MIAVSTAYFSTNSKMWRVEIWLCLLLLISSGVSHADLMSNATLGNLTSPVDTNILLEHRLYDVIWGSGQFVAVGQGAFDETEVFLSPDGIAWERVSLGKPSRPLGVSGEGAGALYGIAWSGAIFVAVGERILTSSDGKSWTVTATFAPCVFSRVIAHGEKFVAVGSDRGRGCLATSLDGKKWTDGTSDIVGNNAVLTSITHTSVGFIALGSANLGRFGLASIFLFSPDGGKSWSRQLGPQDFLVDLTGNASLFVAVGGLAQRSAIFTSPDGQHWTEKATTLRHPLRAVAWNGAVFVAVGVEGSIAISTGGIAWTEQPSHILQDLFGLAWNGSRFVAVGEGVILTSPDGRHWQEPGGKESSH
ncbi:MAG: WD40/YVTN/BNR-like repeat-containing protein [Candidatus Binatia bacterium]